MRDDPGPMFLTALMRAGVVLQANFAQRSRFGRSWIVGEVRRVGPGWSEVHVLGWPIGAPLVVDWREVASANAVALTYRELRAVKEEQAAAFPGPVPGERRLARDRVREED